MKHSELAQIARRAEGAAVGPDPSRVGETREDHEAAGWWIDMLLAYRKGHGDKRVKAGAVHSEWPEHEFSHCRVKGKPCAALDHIAHDSETFVTVRICLSRAGHEGFVDTRFQDVLRKPGGIEAAVIQVDLSPGQARCMAKQLPYRHLLHRRREANGGGKERSDQVIEPQSPGVREPGHRQRCDHLGQRVEPKDRIRGHGFLWALHGPDTFGLLEDDVRAVEDSDRHPGHRSG